MIFTLSPPKSVVVSYFWTASSCSSLNCYKNRDKNLISCQTMPNPCGLLLFHGSYPSHNPRIGPPLLLGFLFVLVGQTTIVVEVLLKLWLSKKKGIPQNGQSSGENDVFNHLFLVFPVNFQTNPYLKKLEVVGCIYPILSPLYPQKKIHKIHTPVTSRNVPQAAHFAPLRSAPASHLSLRRPPSGRELSRCQLPQAMGAGRSWNLLGTFLLVP